MKLLALVTDAFGGRGGMAQYNRDFLSAVAASEEVERVTVLPKFPSRTAESTPPKVHVDVSAPGGSLHYGAACLRHVIRGGYDGVICGHVTLLPFAWLAAARERVPFQLIAYGIEAWSPPRVVLRPFLRPDAVVAISDYTMRRFREWSGFPDHRMMVVPGTFDRRRFTPGQPSPALLARYGLEGRRVLLTVARLAANERYKGIDQLLEALPGVRERVPNVCYLIVGDGDDRGRIEARVRALGLDDAVRMAGYVSEEEKVDHYRIADAFAMTGWGEGFGLVYLEALACGVPAVGSILDASADALRHGELGAVVNPTDESQLVSAVVAALEKGRGEAPRELDHFSTETFVAGWTAAIGRAFGGMKNRAV